MGRSPRRLSKEDSSGALLTHFLFDSRLDPRVEEKTDVPVYSKPPTSEASYRSGRATRGRPLGRGGREGRGVGDSHGAGADRRAGVGMRAGRRGRIGDEAVPSHGVRTGHGFGAWHVVWACQRIGPAQVTGPGWDWGKSCILRCESRRIRSHRRHHVGMGATLWADSARGSSSSRSWMARWTTSSTSCRAQMCRRRRSRVAPGFGDQGGGGRFSALGCAVASRATLTSRADQSA